MIARSLRRIRGVVATIFGVVLLAWVVSNLIERQPDFRGTPIGGLIISALFLRVG